jgi:hypothetical protein
MYRVRKFVRPYLDLRVLVRNHVTADELLTVFLLCISWRR